MICVCAKIPLDPHAKLWTYLTLGILGNDYAVPLTDTFMGCLRPPERENPWRITQRESRKDSEQNQQSSKKLGYLKPQDASLDTVLVLPLPRHASQLPAIGACGKVQP